MPERRCAHCEGPLPEGASNGRRYCQDKCRVAGNRAKHAALPGASPALRRSLAFALVERPEAVEVLRDEVREIVRAQLSDNVLRFGQELTGLLPKVLETLEADLASRDWTIRKSAQQMVLRSLMPLLERREEDASIGTITVVHHTPTPEVGDEGKNDDWESTFVVCENCNETHHPETVVEVDGKTLCRGCNVRLHYRELAALGAGDASELVSDESGPKDTPAKLGGDE